MERLIKILSHKRPAGSVSEAMLIAELFEKYEHTDMKGNVVITVPHADGSESKTLFSCHTDTVHSTDGTQALAYDENLYTIMLDDPTPIAAAPKWEPGQLYVPRHRDCLGADDGAGWWLLMEMIDAGVPGTYVFHHSEEVGGLGSRALSADKEWLGKFNRAVAFDRRGTGDVIDFQRGGRCCSTTFAGRLSAALNEHGLKYKPASGVFTDTANYTTLISECTNISCGYYNEHMPGEWLDVDHLVKLRSAVIRIDWESLPTARDPSYLPPKWHGGFDGGYTPVWGKSKAGAKTEYKKYLPATLSQIEEMTYDELCTEAWNDPDNVALILFELMHPECSATTEVSDFLIGGYHEDS